MPIEPRQSCLFALLSFEVSSAGIHWIVLTGIAQAEAFIYCDPSTLLNWSILRYVVGHEKADHNAEKAPQA